MKVHLYRTRGGFGPGGELGVEMYLEKVTIPEYEYLGEFELSPVSTETTDGDTNVVPVASVSLEIADDD